MMNTLSEARALLAKVVERAINEGVGATVDEAMLLAQQLPTHELCDAAHTLRKHWNDKKIDTCSIINARSGKCSEDCKWCSQSRFHHTGVEEYDMVDTRTLTELLDRNSSQGVMRFSMVTSGRKVSPAHIPLFANLYRLCARRSSISLCASMGLLGKEELRQLREAGVSRYHCNLETAASFFPTLCSTHTPEQKLATIRAAQEVGMEVCSGGIIGMGETLRHRLELAAEVVEAGAVSMPVNLLNPIPGTPLGSMPLLDEEEVVRSVALMKLVAPKVSIRFAGGRKRMSREATLRMFRGGVSGAMVGDMLTTEGNEQSSDRELFREVEEGL